MTHRAPFIQRVPSERREGRPAIWHEKFPRHLARESTGDRMRLANVPGEPPRTPEEQERARAILLRSVAWHADYYAELARGSTRTDERQLAERLHASCLSWLAELAQPLTTPGAA